MADYKKTTRKLQINYKVTDLLPVICYIPTTGHYFFLMICTKSVIRNNLSRLNKHIQKQRLCFISPQ